MKAHRDVIIIGGGIIGLACAHYLIKQNKSVTIIDQGLIGSGASHGNCGLLHFSGIIPLCAPGVVKHEMSRFLNGTSPLHIKPTIDFQLFKWLIQFAAHCKSDHMRFAANAKHELLRYSLDLFAPFLNDLHLECDFEKKGVLFLFKDESYLKKYETTNTFLDQYNIGGKKLALSDARNMEPAINENVVGAWFNEHDWHLRPEKLVQAWKNKLIDQGVNIQENCKCLGFNINNKKIEQVNTNAGDLSADMFILSTGAWSSEMKDQLNLNIPVQPGKGYSVTMENLEPCPKVPCYLYERNVVATPWQSGYRLGGTMEFSGFDDALNKKRLEKLFSGAREYLIQPDKQVIGEEWSGFRPMTYDDLPVIDQSPNQDNLFVTTGHGMLGLSMATGTGKALSDWICTGNTEIDLSPFSIGRF